MKKHWIVAILLTIAFVLSGCGEVTLEEKIAQVREDNTITVQDVIDLMKLEGLEVEKMTPSSEFQSRWPNGEVVKINDTHYMALQAFEENLNQRTYTLFETKFAVFRDKISCVCPVFVKNVAVFVLNETINVD